MDDEDAYVFPSHKCRGMMMRVLDKTGLDPKWFEDDWQHWHLEMALGWVLGPTKAVPDGRASGWVLARPKETFL